MHQGRFHLFDVRNRALIQCGWLNVASQVVMI